MEARARSLAAIAAGCLSLLSLLSGCDECKTGQPAMCDGNSVRTCQSNGHMFSGASWQVYPCKAPNPYCILGDPGETPACVATPSPVVECMGATTAIPRLCLQNGPAACNDGYASTRGACEAGPCVVAADASCAYCDDGTTNPDPGCTQGVNSTCFDGNLFSCECERRSTMILDCAGEGRVCLPGPDGVGHDHYCGVPSNAMDASLSPPLVCGDATDRDGASCAPCSDADACTPVDDASP